MSKLLINESPLQVLPTLAVTIGLNEAIVLQQVHYWLENARKGNNERKYRDYRFWVFNTYEEWKENNFPWWSIDTIKRIFLRLEDMQLILSAQFDGNDRRKWYSINYDTLFAFEIGLVRSGSSGQNALMEIDQGKMPFSIRANCPLPTGQNAPMLNKESENTSETTTEKGVIKKDKVVRPWYMAGDIPFTTSPLSDKDKTICDQLLKERGIGTRMRTELIELPHTDLFYIRAQVRRAEFENIDTPLLITMIRDGDSIVWVPSEFCIACDQPKNSHAPGCPLNPTNREAANGYLDY